ncbi:acyltransferase family protein [Pseudoduganella lutea]|nr:acyltransferase [Pseudoduganella lutea]
MKEADDKLHWVQALRGIAVLLVVLTHTRYVLLDTDQFALADRLMMPGAMGVDLFFIISGFIMVYTTTGMTGVRSAALFGVKRVARIWPAYAVITLGWVLLRHGGSYFADAARIEQFVKSLLYMPVDPANPPFFGYAFPLGWTLAFEMYFYLAFGLCMLAGRLRWFAFAVWMFITLMLLPLDRGGPTLDVRQHLATHSPWLHLAMNPIIWEFLAGVAIGHLYLCSWFRVHSVQTAWLMTVCGIGFAAWFVFGRIGTFHGPAQWGWPLALMVTLLALASKTVVFKPPAALVWLGTVSYSMYLTHYLGQMLLLRYLPQWGVDTKTWAQVFLTVLFALPLAALAHWLLEVKLSGMVRRLLMAALDRALPARAGTAAPEAVAAAN